MKKFKRELCNFSEQHRGRRGHWKRPADRWEWKAERWEWKTSRWHWQSAYRHGFAPRRHSEQRKQHWRIRYVWSVVAICSGTIFYYLNPTFLCHIFNYLMLLLHAQPCMHAFDDFELLFWQSPQAHANSWQQWFARFWWQELISLAQQGTLEWGSSTVWQHLLGRSSLWESSRTKQTLDRCILKWPCFISSECLMFIHSLRSLGNHDMGLVPSGISILIRLCLSELSIWKSEINVSLTSPEEKRNGQTGARCILPLWEIKYGTPRLCIVQLNGTSHSLIWLAL